MSQARYDAIFLDAYRQPYIPFYLLTREFFALMRAHLNPGGMVIVNVGHIPGSDALEKVVSATLHAVFGVRRARRGQRHELAGGGEPGAALVRAAGRAARPAPAPAGRQPSPRGWGRRCAAARSTPTTRRRSSG